MSVTRMVAGLVSRRVGTNVLPVHYGAVYPVDSMRLINELDPVHVTTTCCCFCDSNCPFYRQDEDCIKKCSECLAVKAG